ncbi:hypothetical protein ABH966_001112 [Lysinibacillus sp. RC46]
MTSELFFMAVNMKGVPQSYQNVEVFEYLSINLFFIF